MRVIGKNVFGFLVLGLLLQGCASAELAVDLFKKHKRQTESGKQSKVVAKPHYKIGNPYQEFGVWYYPKRDLTYDETGLASWYGEETAILGRPTANGEVFDPNIATAAHKTLPMPSVVRVTNLDNGRSLVVRLNDRGPFAPGRIIDLSHEGARLLGFVEQGIAKVRVQILAEQSLRLENLAKRGEFPSLTNPSNRAPSCDKSMIRPGAKGPRSFNLTTSDLPLSRLVTRTTDGSGKVLCAAVAILGSNTSPFAVGRPKTAVSSPYQDARPVSS